MSCTSSSVCQGVSAEQINIVFNAVVVSHILYALPACGAHLATGLMVFLNRTYEFGFYKEMLHMCSLSLCLNVLPANYSNVYIILITA